MDSRGGGGVKNDAVYWIWLSRGLGVASTAARIVLEKGLDAKALYQMDLTALIQLELLAPRLCKKLKALPLTAVYNVLEDCAQKGYSVITPEDDNYPRQFYALQDPPLVVYAQGNVALLGQMHNLPVLTVVGTRSASEYGSRVAENMSHDLAQAGFICSTRLTALSTALLLLAVRQVLFRIWCVSRFLICVFVRAQARTMRLLALILARVYSPLLRKRRGRLTTQVTRVSGES